MAASDYVPIFFKNRLHLAGRPQMSTRPKKRPPTEAAFTLHRLRYLRGGRLLRRQYPTKARHSSRMTMVAISALPSPAIIKIIWSIESSRPCRCS